MGNERTGRTESFDARLIAPCGMNCGLCYAFLRTKNTCTGCNGDDAHKPAYCVTCKMRTCDDRGDHAAGFCFTCATFPCKRLKQLDKRYRTKYGMSMLENLAAIRDQGIAAFVAWERERWTCPGCGGVICVHKKECPTCGRPRDREMKGGLT